MEPSDHELLIRIDERLKALGDHMAREFEARDKALDAFTTRSARTQSLILALIAGGLTATGLIITLVVVLTQ